MFEFRISSMVSVFGPALLLLVAFLLGGCGPSEAEILDRYDPYASRQGGEREFVEVDLGQYYATYPQLDTGATRVMRAQLCGVVPQSRRTAVLRAYAQRRQSMRSHVRRILQEFDVHDSTPDAMESLKSDLAKTVRQALRTDDVKEVVFTDLSIE